MLMLLVSAPVLMDDPVARHFLEDAQHLGAVMAGALTAADKPPGGAAAPSGAAAPKDGLDEAIRQLRHAADPLLRLLSPAVRDSVESIGRTAEE